MVPTKHKCPNCKVDLVRKYPRRQIFTCPKCGNNYKAKLKRKARSNFDINDQSTWHATCVECGCKKMEYHNYKYHCPKCGHVLYV